MGLDSIGVLKQSSPIGTGVDVTALVLQDLSDRREAGWKKYGTPLKTNNGRDALIDAYQELLDLVCYMRQKIEEDKERQVLKEIGYDRNATTDSTDGATRARDEHRSEEHHSSSGKREKEL